MKLKNVQGISIIEVTITVVILSIIALGISAIFGAGQRNTIIAAHANEAINNALAGMELVKSIPYAQLPTAGAYTTAGPIPSIIAPIVKVLTLGKNTTANRSITIKNIDDPAGGGANDYKEITVTVSWEDGGIPRQRSLVSYMAQR